MSSGGIVWEENWTLSTISGLISNDFMLRGDEMRRGSVMGGVRQNSDRVVLPGAGSAQHVNS